MRRCAFLNNLIDKKRFNGVEMIVSISRSITSKISSISENYSSFFDHYEIERKGHHYQSEAGNIRTIQVNESSEFFDN